jgi:integrase
MPAGYYGTQKRVYHCSHTCSNKSHFARKTPLKCRYCGKTFKPRSTNRGKPFCSKEHTKAWLRDQALKSKFGRFTSLVQEFLEDCRARQLSPGSLSCLEGNLAAFFRFVLRMRIRSLETVGPRHITAFMAEHKLAKPKTGGNTAYDVHGFFAWMVETKRRKAPNPVVLTFHGWKRPRTEPRPYSQAELALIRSRVQDDPQLKLAIEIGVEAGLRISETCNLRTTDCDLERQQFFVRLPTKTRTERSVPFHTRTLNALQDWLKQRPEAEHDFLFVGRDNQPLRKHTLRLRLNSLLCGPGGLSSLSFHRLRHTAASAVYPALETGSVMRTFGWRSRSAMQTYTRVDPVSMRKSYARAMDSIEKGALHPALPSESIEAYFDEENPSK